MTQLTRCATLWTLIAVLVCALLAEVASATAGPPPEAIREAQELLARLGYAPGPADGVWGQNTVRAYRAFLRDEGRPDSTTLTRKALNVMRRLVERQSGGAVSRRGVSREQIGREVQVPTRRGTGPGQRFRDCPECPEMVVVPAGSFMMGSPATEENRKNNEGPVHRVRIGRPFAVGVHEVTRGEFTRFIQVTGRSMGNSCRVLDTSAENWAAERPGFSWRDPGYRQNNDHPVVCVSWYDAQAYVQWLSKATNHRYRLLSESEWEYVARAGTRTARYWGATESQQCSYANGADTSTKFDWRAGCNDGYARSSPVGKYQGNAYGLHDVLGNVWEWVQDCWTDSYAGVPNDGRAWESGRCTKRVHRGGSWGSFPGYVRAAARYGNSAELREYSLGFRVARTLSP